MVITIKGNVRHNGQLLSVGGVYEIEEKYGKRLVEKRAAIAGAQMNAEGQVPTVTNITEAVAAQAKQEAKDAAERMAFNAGFRAGLRENNSGVTAQEDAANEAAQTPADPNINSGALSPEDVAEVTPSREPEVTITPSKTAAKK